MLRGTSKGLAAKPWRSDRKLGFLTALCIFGASLSGGLFAGAGNAAAQTRASAPRIGDAVLVQNDVARVRGATRVALSGGEAVFRNETIATAEASSARLTFLDQTNLSIGPQSRIVLDRFVFSGDANAQAVTMNLVRGAFRFSTGSLDKRAYKINVPTASIGVRGTILDILVGGARTIVTLVDDGQALVCTRDGRQCAQLLQPGDTVVVDASGARRTNSPGARFSFAQLCAGTPGLCAGSTQFAQAGDALCGR